MKYFFRFIVIIVSLIPVVGLSQTVPNVFTYKVGQTEVILLSEGQGTGTSGIFLGATPEMIQRAMPNGTYPNSCNAFLVRMKGKNILVDAGRSAQILLENLRSIGVAPEQIDYVLITHVHGDHIGGLLRDGQAVFPNAEMFLSQAEYDYGVNGGDRTAGARNVFEAYKSKLNTIEAQEIDTHMPHFFLRAFDPELPMDIRHNQQYMVGRIRPIAAYGHTPGHTLFMIESGDEKLLIWGDLTHAMAIQMPYPQVAMTFDVNPEMAIAARRKVLEYVAANNIMIAGVHNAFPGMGWIRKTSDGGYAYHPPPHVLPLPLAP